MTRRLTIAMLWYTRYAEAHQRAHAWSRYAMDHGQHVMAIVSQRRAAEAYENMSHWRELYVHEAKR